MSGEKYRILFMGTPDFACPTLEALAKDLQIEVPLVISQPDAKRGRKMEMHPSPVKAKAQVLGLVVETPDKVSTPEYIEKIKALNLDAVLVMAYGQLLKQDLLDVLPDRFINIHASLLPRWRGAAPIQRALMAGDKETGLSFQVMRLKLDSGPIIFEKKVEIQPNEDSFDLQEILSTCALGELSQVIKNHVDGKTQPQEQNEADATYAKKIQKAEGLIDWSKTAGELHDQIRGLQWGQGAYTQFNGKRLKVSDTEVQRKGESWKSFEEGVICSIEILDDEFSAVLVSTKEDVLVIKSLQPEGKLSMKAKDFVNGYGLTIGQRFS